MSGDREAELQLMCRVGRAVNEAQVTATVAITAVTKALAQIIAQSPQVADPEALLKAVATEMADEMRRVKMCIALDRAGLTSIAPGKRLL